MKKFLEKNGVEFSESMFKQNTTMSAYIRFTHELSHAHVIHNMTNVMDRTLKNPNLTSTDITKKQLEEDFGFTYELKSIE